MQCKRHKKTYSRLSVFFTTRVDGVLEIWDFLYRQKGPILPVKVADYPLLSMKVTTQINFWMHEGTIFVFAFLRLMAAVR